MQTLYPDNTTTHPAYSLRQGGRRVQVRVHGECLLGRPGDEDGSGCNAHTISNILGVMATQVQLLSDIGEPVDLRSDIDEEVVLVLVSRERMEGE